MWSLRMHLGCMHASNASITFAESIGCTAHCEQHEALHLSCTLTPVYPLSSIQHALLSLSLSLPCAQYDQPYAAVAECFHGCLDFLCGHLRHRYGQVQVDQSRHWGHNTGRLFSDGDHALPQRAHNSGTHIMGRYYVGLLHTFMFNVGVSCF